MARELRRPVPAPDLDAEQEIDLARYAATVAARWWLLLLGVLAGVVVGYVLSFGGSVYRAEALVNLGEPIGPGGGRIAGLATLGTVIEIVRSESVVRRVANKVDLTPAELRRGISVRPVPPATARGSQPPLVNVIVEGGAPGKVAAAATQLGQITVNRLSPYVNSKIRTLKAQIASADREIESIDARSDAAVRAAEDPELSQIERLIALTNAGVLEQRRATLQQQRSERAQLLTFAQQVEAPQLVVPAASTKVTARSRRNSIVVGGVIGLLVGLFAALAWDRVAALRPAR